MSREWDVQAALGELLPFTRMRHCPKCEASPSSIEARYRAATWLPIRRLTRFEHMERRCQACGYRWPETATSREHRR